MTQHGHKYRRITVEKANGEVVSFDSNDPEAEPVFLLRGQDVFAYRAVDHYAEMLRQEGLLEQSAHAKEHALAMHHWPVKKVPD